MFRRKVTIEYRATEAAPVPCPVRWIDSFAMRNFTNDAIFDDTLPLGDGLMEIGNRIPLDHLAAAMEDWFRRKGYLKLDESLRILEQLLLR